MPRPENLPSAGTPPIDTQPNRTVKMTVDMPDMPKGAPGETTTEFWLTALGVLAATVLAAFGKLDGTAALAAITGGIGTYNVSRGLAKR